MGFGRGGDGEGYGVWNLCVCVCVSIINQIYLFLRALIKPLIPDKVLAATLEMTYASDAFHPFK